MRRIRNDRLIRRNSALGRVLMFGGLGILGLGFLVSLAAPGVALPFLAVFFLGMISSQIGILMMGRWSRGPRADERIDAALKGLDDRYVVLHYVLGAPHVVLAPSGIYPLVPLIEEGEMRESAGRWTRRLPRRGRLRPARTESLPDLQGRAARAASGLRRSLARKGWQASDTAVRPVLVFLSPQAEIEASPDAAPAAVHAKKLKEWLRRQPRAEGLRGDDLAALESRLIPDG